MGRTKLDSVLSKYFSPGDKLVDGKMMFIMTVSCSDKDCTEVAEVRDKRGVDPNFYRQHLGHKGWIIPSNFKKPLCGKCSGNRRDRPEYSADECTTETPEYVLADAMHGGETMLREPAIETVGSDNHPFTSSSRVSGPVTASGGGEPPKKPVEPLRRSQKIGLAEMYFEDNFVIEDPNYPACPKGHGYYRDGFSDEEGADICQLSMDEFRSLREEDYGKLWERPNVNARMAKLDQQFTLALAEILRETTAIKAILHFPAGTLPEDMQKEVDKARQAGAHFRIEWQKKLERCLSTFDDDMQAEIDKVTAGLQAKWDATLEQRKATLEPKLAALETYTSQILEMRKDVDYVRLNAKV